MSVEIEIKVCENCGHENKREAVICEQCGSLLPRPSRREMEDTEEDWQKLLDMTY